MLFLVAIGIMLGVVVYNERTVRELRESSRRYLTLKIERYRELLTRGEDEALDDYLREMATRDFPLIVADAQGIPVTWSGLESLDKLPHKQAMEEAQRLMHNWERRGNRPVEVVIPEFDLRYLFYYGDNPAIKKLRWLPWIEAILVGGLVLVGYVGFVSIKRNEERAVWVGLARETAHQLGTPISALLGWLENLTENEATAQLAHEMGRDLERLKVIINRFQQIGSQPKLERLPLRPVVERVSEYLQRRLPAVVGSRIEIVIDLPSELTAWVNPVLWEWAMENILRNSAEAMKGRKGQIVVKGWSSKKKVIVDVIDQGVGIPRRQWKEIFRSGYTTKERGWGLGLSLARRIIEDFHKGYIYVHSSDPQSGTVMRTILRG